MPRISNLLHTALFLSAGGFAMVATTSATVAANALAVAENVTIDTGAATYAIKKIELHETLLTDSTLAALLDAKDTTAAADRLAKLSAAEILIPEIVVTTKTAPFQKLVYQNIKLTDVQSGKASSADIEATHLSVSSDTDAALEGEYGHSHAQAIDLRLAAHIMTEARKDENEPIKPIYDSILVENVKLKGSGKEAFTLSIGSMSAHDVKGRAFAKKPSELQTLGNNSNQIAGVLKDVLTSFDIGESEIKGIEFETKSDDKPLTISLGKISMGQFHSGKTADIEIGPLVVMTDGTTVKIGDIDLKDLDFPNLRDYSAKPAAPEADAATAEQPQVFIPTITQLRVEKVAVDIADDNGKPSQTTPGFTIEHFQLNGGAPIATLPTQATLALDHFVFDLAAGHDSNLKPLIDMGYSKLDASGHIEMGWDAATEKLAISDISVSGVDMGKVGVSALIDNVTKDFFSTDATVMQAAAFGALVKRIDITVTNTGLVDRAFSMQAKAQNKSVDEIKRQFITAAAVGLPAMLDNKPAAKLIGAALGRFIAMPKTFHLTATSADGLGVPDFALISDPGTLLDALDIKATANE